MNNCWHCGSELKCPICGFVPKDEPFDNEFRIHLLLHRDENIH